MASFMGEGSTLLEVKNLKKYFPVRRGLLSSLLTRGERYIRAVDGVSFKVRSGEVFGLVGESGCGKTTTARAVLRLIEPTEGRIIYRGTDLMALSKERMKELRREMQIIFQDPFESLNPKMTIYDTVSEPLAVHGYDGERLERVSEALKSVQLVPPEEFLFRYPHELSGGQRQRVAIARALVLSPRFVVADEPVSMLDASVRTEVLNLMLDLKERLGLTYLFITHDLAVAKYMCDELAVMYLGRIVESGPAVEVLESPQHPYTQALLSAVPEIKGGRPYL